ncbi:MAG: DUF4915 domain-containing protein [Armatimonadota bacterium]
MPSLLTTSHTPAHGGVFLLNTETAETRKILDVPCRGITRGPDGYYTVENFGVVHYLDPKTWQPVRRAETGYAWCHDLKWFGGYFYLVASKGNWVVRLDSDFRELDRMQIVESDDDVCHANCIEEMDGELILSIFTLVPGKREEKNGSHPWRHDGKVLRLDWQRRGYEVLHEPLSQPHSLNWRDGQIYCCESYTSKLSVIPGGGQRHRTLRKLNGFVRGLTFDGDRAFVGVTRRRLEHYHPMVRWWARLTRWCGVLEMDANTWKPLRRYPLPSRQVYDLTVVR